MSDSAPHSAPPLPGRAPWVAPLALALAVIACLGVFWLAVQNEAHLKSLETQLARRIGEFDSASREARTAAQAANAALADLQTRLSTLESRNQETQNQQLALNAMYQELAHSADERVVADIEQTLLLAQQQLRLASNVKAALIGLEAAEARLARLGKRQFDGLRQAIAQDTQRLKLMPGADIDTLIARLDTLVQQVSALPSEAESEPPPTPARAPTPGALGTLSTFSQEAWSELKSLLRIRRLDHPELPLLTPAQRYFLEQNLKLRLVAARIGALQRDETAFRADLAAARAWVLRYYTPKAPPTQAFIRSLDELHGSPIALRDAELRASLQAVRTARGNPE